MVGEDGDGRVVFLQRIDVPADGPAGQDRPLMDGAGQASAGAGLADIGAGKLSSGADKVFLGVSEKLARR